MNTYYLIKAINIDGDDEVLFGSFDKSDCTYEMQSEKDSWKADGYKQIKLTSRSTDDQPDPEVYGRYKPEQYKMIRVWGQMMGSFEYYIAEQQARASAENAPLNAIFKGDESWATTKSILSVDTLHNMLLMVANKGA